MKVLPLPTNGKTFARGEKMNTYKWREILSPAEDVKWCPQLVISAEYTEMFDLTCDMLSSFCLKSGFLSVNFKNFEFTLYCSGTVKGVGG